MKRIRNSVKAIIVSLCLVVIFAGAILGVVLANRNKTSNPGSTSNGGVEEIVYKLTEAQEALMSSIYNSKEERNVLTETDWSKVVYENGEPVPAEKVIGVYEDYFIAKDRYNNRMLYYYAKDESQNNVSITLVQLLINNGYDIESNSILDLKFVENGYIFYELTYTRDNVSYYFEQIAYIEDVENISIVNSFDYTIVGENKYWGSKLVEGNMLLQFSKDFYIYKIDYVESDIEMCQFVICLYTTDAIQDSEKVVFDVEKEKFIDTNHSSNVVTVDIAGFETFVYYVKYDAINVLDIDEEQETKTNYHVVDNGLFIETEIRVAPNGNALFVPEGNSGYYVEYCYKYFDVSTEEIKDYTLTDNYIKAKIINKSNLKYFVVFEQKLVENRLYDEGILSYYDYDFNKILSYQTTDFASKLYYSENGYVITSDGILASQEQVWAKYVKRFNSEEYKYSFIEMDDKLAIVQAENGYEYGIISVDGQLLFDGELFSEIKSLGDGYFSAIKDNVCYSLNANNSTKTLIYATQQESETLDLLRDFGLYFVDNLNLNYPLSLHSIKDSLFVVNDIDKFEYTTNYSLHNLKLFTSTGLKYYSFSDERVLMVDVSNSSDSIDLSSLEGFDNSLDNYANDFWIPGYTYITQTSGSGNYFLYSLSGSNDYVQISTIGQLMTSATVVVENGGENTFVKLQGKVDGTTYTVSVTGYYMYLWTDSISTSISVSGNRVYVTIKIINNGSVQDWGSGGAYSSNKDNTKNSLTTKSLNFNIAYCEVTTGIGYTDEVHMSQYLQVATIPYTSSSATTFPVETGFEWSNFLGTTKRGLSALYTSYQTTLKQDSETCYNFGAGIPDFNLKLRGSVSSGKLTGIYCTYYSYVLYSPHKYTIKVNYNGCDGTYTKDEYSNYQANSELSIEAPKKYGYLFGGWLAEVSSGASITSSLLSNQSKVKFTCNINSATITITPKWDTTSNTFTLVFGQVNSGGNTVKIFSEDLFKPSKVINSVDTVTNAYNLTSVATTSQFYGKYNGSELTLSTTPGEVGIHELSSAAEMYFTLSLNKTNYYDIISMFDLVGYFSNKVNVFGIPYVIAGWAYHLESQDKLCYISSSDTLDIHSYYTALESNKNSRKVVLYAVYRPKYYLIDNALDDDFGRGSLQDNANLGMVNNVNAEGPYQSNVEYYYIVSGNAEAYSDSWKNYSALSETIQAASSPSFKLELDHQYYMFDRIELLNIGYRVTSKYGDEYYYYATVVIVFGDTGDSFDIRVIKTTSQNIRQTDGVYTSNNVQYIYNYMDEATSQPYKSGDYYYVDDNQNGYNGFKISIGTYADNPNRKYMIVNFNKVGYAGNERGDKTISKDSVEGIGQYGFTFKVYTKSIYKSADEVNSAFYDTNGTSATGKVNIKYINDFLKSNNKGYTDSNYYMLTNVAPVSTGVLKMASGNTLDITYFWLNGFKYVLKVGSGYEQSSFVKKDGSSGVGYYIIGSDYLKYTTGGKTLFYTDGNSTFIAKVAMQTTTDADNKDSVVYYDGENIYYFGQNGNTETVSTNKVNYNNTQIIAISPDHRIIKFSENSSSVSTSSKTRYEMRYYLSNITIGGASTDLKIGKSVEAKGTYYTYVYSSLRKVGENDYYGEKYEYITYLGVKYTVKAVHIINDDYILYFTVNEENNYVMYFLYTTKGENEKTSISLKYQLIQSTISIDVKDVEKGKGFDNGTEKTADVYFYNGATGGSLNYNTLSKEESGYSYYNYSINTYSYNVKLLKIVPSDGYLINKLTIKIDETTLMNFSLYNIGLGYFTDSVTKENYDAYSYKEGFGENTVNKSYFKYYGSNAYFLVDNEESKYAGIFYSETINNKWNLSTSDFGFETIYLLISGIYHNVSINVETASFIEFDFVDNNFDPNDVPYDVLGNLEEDAAPRYELVGGKDYKYNQNGQFYASFVKIEDNITEYYRKYDKTQVKYNESDSCYYTEEGYKISVVNDDACYLLYINAHGVGVQSNYYYIKESPSANNFIIAYKQSGKNYMAAYGGTFILKDVVDIEENGEFTYFKNNEKVDGNISYLLSDVKNLSIIGTDDSGIAKKFGSVDIFNFTGSLFDASLVKIYGNSIRVLFIGKSQFFNEGVQIFASGNNYSAYFTNGVSYNGGDEIFSVIGAANAEGRKYDNSELGENLEKSDNLTYFKISDIKEFFDGTTFNREQTGIIHSKKYFLKVEVFENNVTLNVNSYISNYRTDMYGNTTDYVIHGDFGNNTAKNVFNNEYISVKADARASISTFQKTVSNEKSSNGFYPYMWIGDGLDAVYYQLDYVDVSKQYSKQDSWFNNTVLTNINYDYMGNQVTNVSGQKKSGNWQNQDNGGFSNKVVNEGTLSDPDYLVTDNPKISGYQVEFTYNYIPGYYLEYIMIETVDYGVFYIPLSTNFGSDDIISNYIGDTKIYFYIQYEKGSNDYDSDDYDSKYVVKLYCDVEENDYENALNSLGLLSNNISVNFFSKASAINISYDKNNNNTNISTKSNSTLSLSNQNIYYDTMVTLNATASMEGYTFIGWGSENYITDEFSYESRFDALNLTWNTYSLWMPVVDYFKYDNYNRSYLMGLGSISSDFYIKSTDPERQNSTGYFITDTGHTVTENYNFWSSYATEFKNTMTGRRVTSSIEIDLYAIWKANVYAVELNFNDSVSNNSVKNGTTAANIGLGHHSSFDSYYWNGKTYSDAIYNYSGGLNYSNKIDQNVSKAGMSDTYYCYVTFDKNDWYIVSANNIRSNYNISSENSFNDFTSTRKFLDENRTNNKLDFVIDRYGYSWLGWFSEKLANTYENNFANNGSKVFGSDYYYSRSEITYDNSSRVMPYLRGYTWTGADIYVKISDFEGANDNKNTSVYSEPVYKGEKYFADKKVDYVYHYNYKTKFDDDIDCYVNDDYFNGVLDGSNYLVKNNTGVSTDNSILAYYDTSLTLNSYTYGNSGATIERKGNNYRFITLYAYWSVNDYNVIIDYRDNDGVEDNSIYEIGSTAVTNKTEIETDYEITDIDGSGDKYNIHNTYFDDDKYEYVLNTSIPTRVGYDFVGWSFFYRNPTPENEDVSQDADGFYNRDLYKYNGLQTVNSSYVLNDDTMRYIYYDNEGDNNGEVIALYNQNAIKDGDEYKQSYYLEKLAENSYTQLNTNNEVWGDAEGDGNRYIYIFAMWRAQTFTINVNLNIDTEDLINGYDQDSAYSIGFYDSIAGEYVGINSLFVRQKENERNIDNYANVFAEVVSNLTFVIYFDEPFSTALFMDPNARTTKYYYLADLFAVSTGYYLIDWLYKSNDSNSILIANSLRSEYGYYGEIVNKNEAGNRTSKIELKESRFNYKFYQILYNTNYKNMIAESITDENGLPVSGSKFEENNTKKLTDIDSSGVSTNFGYVTVNGINCYIQPEFVDENSDGKTDSHNLYYRFDGKKYYVLIYTNNISTNVLTNDLTYLYYHVGDKKYIVRFDSEGNPYYVPNTTYAGKVSLNLKLAIFDSKEYISKENIVGNAYPFVVKTTRQFSIYAHWEVKDDFYVSYNNGNNGEYNEGVLINSNLSNPGLAGFYAGYLNGLTTPEVLTANKAHVGGESYLMGYDIDSISHNYQTYDDFGFDLIPFHNGRFVSEVAIEFDRFESSDTVLATGVHQKVRYKLVISFEWDSVNHNIITSLISLYKYSSNIRHCYDCQVDLRTSEESCSICGKSDAVDLREIGDNLNLLLQVELLGATDDDQVIPKVVTIKSSDANANELYLYLSLLNNISFKDQTLFTISKYGDEIDAENGNILKMRDGTSFDRRDVNMLSFNFNDLMTSVYVTCKFSVQTYDLEVHHLFDEKGDTLIQSPNVKTEYTSQYKDTISKDIDYDSEDSLYSSKVYSDNTPTGKNQAIATIPTNLYLYNDVSTDSYNIPYGYFIYGNYYESASYGNRPMDDFYGTGNTLDYNSDKAHNVTIKYKSSDGITEITENISFDGFNFIYSDSNYYKGRGGPGLALDGNITGSLSDYYADQGSPILGSTVAFPTQSVRYNKSFYLFKGWYEIIGKTTAGNVIFDAYDNVDESSYFKRNIVLYGYYYSNNTPTNIQFYTWNNDWNENSPAYLPYTNNGDEYILSASDDMSDYIVENGYLQPSATAVNFVNEDGNLILKSKLEFGVDSSKFSQDAFNGYELSNTTTSDLGLLNKILETYWYYDQTYTLLYTESIAGLGKVYVKFDPEIRTAYDYISLADGEGMIVNASQYDSYISGKTTSFEKLADTQIDGDSGTAIISGVSVDILYDENFASYYFINPNDGKYYFFSENLRSAVYSKRILRKNAFYYEYDGNQIQEIKVGSSTDMTTIYMCLWDSDAQEFDITNTIPLSQESHYTYGERFKGADLYALIDSKYYKYYRVSDSVIQSAPTDSFIKRYEPRYYVDIEGERYYTMIHRKSSSEIYRFVGLYSESGQEFIASPNIQTLYNYYVVLDDVYYKINYKEFVDEGGSKYINPKINESTVEFPYKGVTKTYYFDYNNNSNKHGLFEIYDGNAYDDAVLINYKIYTPLSSSYSLGAVLKSNSWIPTDISLKSFPSLNMDYWYDNPEYVLLGYLKVTDLDLTTMKTSDEQANVFDDSGYRYVPDWNQLIKITNDASYPSSGSYTIFGTVNWYSNVFKDAETGKDISIYYDDVVSKYYFMYTADDGTNVYYYFDKDSVEVPYNYNKVLIKHEQGGQIYNAYSDYVNNKYSGDAYKTLREKLLSAIANKINSFSLSDLLRAPMFVESYKLNSEDRKTIERVVMRISSQYTLSWEDIKAAGLENECRTVSGLAVDKGDETYTITISVTYNYAFSLVTTNTQITTNIYAIPVFVPDVIKFTDENENVSFTEGGSVIYIDYSKMNVTHYDIANQKLYQSDFVWDLSEISPDAPAIDKIERQNLINSADWLQFVMINSDQFDELSNSIIGCDVKLDSMISAYGIDVISQASLSKDNQVLSFDMTGKTGEYYIFAYYYPIGTATNNNKHIHRVSDNYVKVMVEDGVVVGYEIVKNTMTQA